MARSLTLVLLLLMTPLASAEIYRWVDAEGKVRFGDRPPRDAGKLENVDPGPVNSVAPAGDAADGATPSRPATAGNRVVMYATSWCSYCKQARNYFRSQGIRYVEHDIEKSARAKREYDALGATGVPVILVGDARMNGFSEAGFKRIYRK